MVACCGWETSILSPGLFAEAAVEDRIGRVLVVGGRKPLDSVENGLLLNGSDTEAMGYACLGLWRSKKVWSGARTQNLQWVFSCAVDGQWKSRRRA
jgi:hypothetical protein